MNLSESQQLLRKSEEHIRAAQLLLSDRLYNIAVSQAYYAIFYAAEAFLLSAGLSFSKHSGVIGKFGESFAETGRVPKKYHRSLIQAEEARTKADYAVCLAGIFLLGCITNPVEPYL